MINYNEKNSYVILLGNSNYDEDHNLSSIPNVGVNLTSLKDLFTDDRIFGVPDNQILILLDQTKKNINRSINNFISQLPTQSLLTFYYAGHGVISSNDFNLYFPTIDSSGEYIEDEGINAKDLRLKLEKSKAIQKIFIFDCCFSGKIMGKMGGSESLLNPNLGNIPSKTTFIMTSSSEDEPSLFSVDEPNKPTYFTDKLIKTYKLGLDVKNNYCEIGEIFNKIKQDCINDEKNIPQPFMSSRENAHKIKFGRNRRESSLKRLIEENQNLKDELYRFGNLPKENMMLKSEVKDFHKIIRELDLLKEENKILNKIKEENNYLRVKLKNSEENIKNASLLKVEINMLNQRLQNNYQAKIELEKKISNLIKENALLEEEIKRRPTFREKTTKGKIIFVIKIVAQILGFIVLLGWFLILIQVA